ncbi:hypothetical protein BCR44DRAFT_1429994 [Catenaria anguillulae PL171]|uniref:Transmembrane protein n=1 Tax=Catenaria anguillulae PL171 TaxID=765915 RepID=A0A1Y2HVN9_9FUNG|nr:hypothetical protein BCR44DRAFT_1429994 [Catenaria anguillulae PL171]
MHHVPCKHTCVAWRIETVRSASQLAAVSVPLHHDLRERAAPLSLFLSLVSTCPVLFFLLSCPTLLKNVWFFSCSFLCFSLR